MFALIVALSLAASPQPIATPAQISGAPLREIVFKVSYTRHERLNEESFGGGLEPQPAQQGADESDEGTVTVDEMTDVGDTLGLKVVENWNQRRPATYTGSVAPDGSIHFSDQSLSEVSTYLLPFIAPLWTNGRPLDVGTSWTSTYGSATVDASVTYSITAVARDAVTVLENQKVTVRSARGMDGFTTGTVVYKPSMLVPILGKFERRSGRGDATSSDVETMVINFTRVSDSLDNGK